MNQKDLLRCIADAGYNVGFGAKKHFATYDIISKVPSAIGYFSTAVGVYALVFDSLSAKWLSASLIVIGIAGICISIYDHKKNEYSEAGEKLTGLFNQLKKLYFEVQSAEGDMTGFQTKLSEIETLSAKSRNFGSDSFQWLVCSLQVFLGTPNRLDRRAKKVQAF